MQTRRTKIVATIGPACWDEPILRDMLLAGVDVARLNFSHGSHERHLRSLNALRRLAAELGRPMAILQDLQGPKIRVGTLAHGPVELRAGRRIAITTRPVPGDADIVSTTYRDLPRDVKPGAAVLMDDGMIRLRVVEVEDDTVICEVLVGGVLRERKGINLPDTPISAPALTAKDMADLAFGVEHEVDYIGLSFVRKAADVEQARQAVRARGKDIPLIAKIERPEALDELDAILQAADGVMVARGDLGVETSSADVPLLQKRIIRRSGEMGRPDITATEMLQSMMENPRPSRAEACDVANAVFDGTDALMLSGETAAGKYPIEAVRAMSAIAAKAETAIAGRGRPAGQPADAGASITHVTARAASLAAREIQARLIACLTRSGRTAVLVSQQRPLIPIVALTPEATTYRRLALPWGVTPILIEEIERPESMRRLAEEALRSRGLASPGDRVVIVTGDTVTSGATNTIRIIHIEDR